MAALDRLVGTWKVTGGAEGTVTYRWLEGGHFLIQDVDLEQYGERIRGMELIGRERPFGSLSRTARCGRPTRPWSATAAPGCHCPRTSGCRPSSRWRATRSIRCGPGDSLTCPTGPGRRRQDPGPCDSRLYPQRFDPNTATLTGTARLLLSGTHPDLGFDEYRLAACPGGLKHIIENPTMVRGDSGTLWLFLSANQWDNVNYATGWALCGEGSPTAGGGCALLNSFDPASRNRPWWGASGRTAVPPGDARPSVAFPDLPGFGGLSLVAPNPTAAGVQPVYATAHLFWGGASRLRTQVVLRLDTSGVFPALVETESITRDGPGSPRRR